MKPLKSEDVMRAEAFARRIPLHLKNDAMLANVVEQIAEGGLFTEASVNYVERYMQNAIRPMSQTQYQEALAAAIGRRPSARSRS
jgi:histone acetyltransferase (RNA polymerase elongator complex component)